MADISSFERGDARIDREIQDGVDAIRGRPTIALPTADAGIVASYVRKIQGTYEVGRAERDIESAMELLSIAYNTTPQSEGDIRVRISALMNKLIASQQKSQLTMQSATQVATGITRQVQDVFPDWLDAKESDSRAEIEAFLIEDLPKLATSLKRKASDVRAQVLAAASSYDEIFEDASDATAESEAALSARLADKAAVQKDISEAHARREQLKSLVSDLKAQVESFEGKAREYERRAGTAEQRALAVSAVRVGVQALARALPAIAMARGGSAGLLTSAILDVAGSVAPGDGAGEQQRDGAAPEAAAPGEAAEGGKPGQAPEGRDQAANLRDMQLRMLDKAERYEEERRGQSAELAKLAALSKNRLTRDETIHLALKCLNSSLDALGRVKEIAEEIAALSDTSAEAEIDQLVAFLREGKPGEGRAERLVASVDEFFIRQAARWHATAIVSDRFGQVFHEGWSKLNRLSGAYVVGDQLNDYVKEASAKLAAIVAEREAATDRRIASLQAYREMLARDA